MVLRKLGADNVISGLPVSNSLFPSGYPGSNAEC